MHLHSHCWQSKVEMRFLCVCKCVWMRMGTYYWSSIEGRVLEVLLQQQGKGPAMVAMVNVAPCHLLAVPSSSLSVPLLSTIPRYAFFFSHCIQMFWHSQHTYYVYPFLSFPNFSFEFQSNLFSLPPPSLHSGFPAGSRQALHAAQNEVTFSASCQADQMTRHNNVLFHDPKSQQSPTVSSRWCHNNLIS